MKRVLLLGVLSLSLALPGLSGAGENTSWWRYGMGTPCHMTDGPLKEIDAFRSVGMVCRTEDITENGIVVATTMISPDVEALGRASGLAGVGRVTWYRTRERCEAALRQQQQAEEPARRQREQERARLQERYR